MAKEAACRIVGRRVRLTGTEGIYEGILNAVDPKNTRMSLEKVKSIQTGERLQGVHHFFQREIISVEILDNRKEIDNDLEGPLVVTNKRNPHLDNLKHVNRRDMLLSAKSQVSGPTLTRYQNFDEVEENVECEVTDWPNHYIFIDAINKGYTEAIRHIGSESVVGVAVEGLRVGRHGDISLIQIATRKHVFVFDVLKLGATLFESGLGRILEQPNIEKVIHDSRYLSDALLHQFDIKLNNVHDTQVAEVILYKKLHGGDLPRYVQSYSSLLMQHLNFDSNHAFFYRQREEAVLVDRKIWLTRPVVTAVLEVAVRHVMHLLQLRLTMMNKMLRDFTEGTDIYLSLVRDAPDEKSQHYQAQTNLVPQEFNRIFKQAEVYQNIYRKRYKRGTNRQLASMVDKHGHRENCTGPLDNNIIYSSDSMWHAGTPIGNGKSISRYLQECQRYGRFLVTSDGYNHCVKDRQPDSITDDDDDDDDCLLNLGRNLNVKDKRSDAYVKKMDKRKQSRGSHDSDTVTVSSPDSDLSSPTVSSQDSDLSSVTVSGLDSDISPVIDTDSDVMRGVIMSPSQPLAGLGRGALKHALLRHLQKERPSSNDSGYRSGMDYLIYDSNGDSTQTSRPQGVGVGRGRGMVSQWGRGEISPTIPTVYPGLGRGNLIGRGVLKK